MTAIPPGKNDLSTFLRQQIDRAKSLRTEHAAAARNASHSSELPNSSRRGLRLMLLSVA